jgi:hypothetical protein
MELLRKVAAAGVEPNAVPGFLFLGVSFSSCFVGLVDFIKFKV